MAGEIQFQSPLDTAMRARQQYLEFGAEPNFGEIPPDDLLPLAEAVQDVKLEPYAAFDAAWLEAETAVSVLRYYPNRDWDTRLDPDILANRARSRWQDIYLIDRNSPLFRSRAMLAAGTLMMSLSVNNRFYDDQVDLTQVLDKYQVPAASILQKALKRRPDPELDHEIHCQTLMLTLMMYSSLGNGTAAFPLPTRFQESGSDFSADMRISLFPDSEAAGPYMSHVCYLRVAALDPTVIKGGLVVPPSLLLNSEYSAREPHGTLAALLKAGQIATSKYSNQRQQFAAAQGHNIRVHANLLSTLRGMVFTGVETLRLEADITSDLEKAREWYSSLSAYRRLIPEDAEAFETAISVHEYAVAGKKATPQDMYRLAWMSSEAAKLSGGAGSYERAMDMFNKAAEKASKQQSWALYIEAKIGEATALAHQAMEGSETTPEHFQQYLDKLLAVAQGISQGFASIEGSPHHPRILEDARALILCLALTADPDRSHIATFASPRQRKRTKNYVGIDVTVFPLGDQGFNINDSGRLRLNGEATDTTDLGIATLTPEMLAELGWEDDLEMLQAVIDEVTRFMEYPDGFEPDERIERLRNELIERADPTRFI